MQTTQATHEWLSPADLARELEIPVQTVYGWRYQGTGPISYRIGKHVRYKREDVDRWLEEQCDRRGAAKAS